MAGSAPTGLGNRTQIVDWIVRIPLGLPFVAAGGAKLAGAPPMVAIFDQIGVGQWFRLLTGASEAYCGFVGGNCSPPLASDADIVTRGTNPGKPGEGSFRPLRRACDHANG